MSARLALRLAAFETLCPYALRAAQTPSAWPTLAGPLVYDTRLDPIEASDQWDAFLASIEGKPIVILYTEEDEVGNSSGEYPPDRETVGLVVEMMIAARGVVEIVNAAGEPQDIGSLDAAITDGQREALLDVLESQVRAALDPQGWNRPPVWLAIAMELHHIRSLPQRDASKTVKLAARTLRMTLRVKMDQPTLPLAAGAPPPTGIAALPQPLQAVAALLPSGSPSLSMLSGVIAPAFVSPGNLTPLDGMNLYVNLGRGDAPTATSFDVQGAVDTTSAGAAQAQGLAAWLARQSRVIVQYLAKFWPN